MCFQVRISGSLETRRKINPVIHIFGAFQALGLPFFGAKPPASLALE
jgi:hypothetical protein